MLGSDRMKTAKEKPMEPTIVLSYDEPCADYVGTYPSRSAALRAALAHPAAYLEVLALADLARELAAEEEVSRRVS